MIGNFAALFAPLINVARLAAWPVGSIYMSMNATSPGTLFGGTWERIAYGRMLIGADSASYPAGSTGGEAIHYLTRDELPYVDGRLESHSAEQIAEKASQWYNATGVFSASQTFNGYAPARNKVGDNATSLRTIVFRIGGGQPHNNMPPYLAVYMWKRTA